MALPSIRECMLRLDAAAVDAPRLTSMDEAVTQVYTLLQLAKDLAANLRNYGTPPVEVPTLKVAAQSLGGTAPHLHRPSTWTDVIAAKSTFNAREKPAPKPRTPVATRPVQAVRRAAHIPAGMVNLPQAGEICCLSPKTLRNYIDAGTFVPPETRHGRQHLWLRTAIEAWAAERHQRRASQAVPDGYMTSEQVAERIGHGITHLWHLVSQGRFPDTTEKVGLKKIWPASVVESWARRRADVPRSRTPTKVLEIPPGHVTAKQLAAQLKRTESWLYAAVKEQGFPQPAARVGGTSLWLLAEAQAWLASRPPRTNGRNTRKPFGVLSITTTSA